MLDDQQAAKDSKTQCRPWFPTLLPALKPLNIVTFIRDHSVKDIKIKLKRMVVRHWSDEISKLQYMGIKLLSPNYQSLLPKISKPFQQWQYQNKVLLHYSLTV